jgi:hypothetical protein
VLLCAQLRNSNQLQTAQFSYRVSPNLICININVEKFALFYFQLSLILYNSKAGTEVGHAQEEYSHYDGYRVNIALNQCINYYIKSNLKFIGKLRTGAPRYIDANMNVYTLEGNHWNVLIKEC